LGKNFAMGLKDVLLEVDRMLTLSKNADAQAEVKAFTVEVQFEQAIQCVDMGKLSRS
jgi:hypothetical protein